MPFSAINTYEQELKQRNVRHTLELQLEQAMAVYHSALESQSSNDFAAAFNDYRKLFEFDVLQPQKLANISDGGRDPGSTSTSKSTSRPAASVTKEQLGPAIRLRAMALKNFALMMLHQENLSIESANEALSYLGESLDLIGTDDPEKLVLPSMVQVYWALGFTHMARRALEILVQNEDSSAIQPLRVWTENRTNARRLLGPRTIEYLESLDYMTQPQHSEPVPKFLRKFTNLRNLSSKQMPLADVLESESTAVVSLAAKSWESLIVAINDVLNSASKRSKRKGIRDTYAWSHKDIWNVELQGILFNRSGTAEPMNASMVASTTSVDETLAPVADRDNKFSTPPQSPQLEQSSTPRTPGQDKSTDLERQASTNARKRRRSVADEVETEEREDVISVMKAVRDSNETNQGGQIEEEDVDAEEEESRKKETYEEDGEDADANNESCLDATEEQEHDDLVTSAELIEPPGTPLLSHTTKPDVPASPVVASPVKRRRTDRVKRSNLALPADFGVTDAHFASQLNAYSALANNNGYSHSIFYSPAHLFMESHQEPSPELAGAAELRDLLTAWDSRESKQLLMEAASARPQKGGIMTTLRKGNVASSGASSVNDGNDEEETEDPLEESNHVDTFVSSHEHLHIQKVRWSLANNLLAHLSVGGHSRRFANMVFRYVDALENIIYSRRNFLPGALRTAMYGLYADQWIQKRSTEEEIKLYRWKLISSQSPSLPHAWITAFVDQEKENASPESSIAQFQDILDKMSESDENPELFSHLKEIPELTIANAQMQISKFKAASAFESVLAPAASDQSSLSDGAEGKSHTSNDEDIELLEAMLMPESHQKPDTTSDSEFEAIQNFLSYAQPQFKMGLWYLLLEKYEAGGSVTNSLTGLTKIFMEAQAAFTKGEPLLSTLSVSHDVGKRLVGLLQRSPDLLMEELKVDQAQPILEEIMKLLQTLHLFLIYDEAVNSNLMQKPVTPSWVQASNKLRELVVIWWTLFYRFWQRCVDPKVLEKPDTANDILSVIHERLGHLGYCGLADGCLLTLHISEISKMDWDGSALDMCQCLKCKFGLNLTLYGDIANHHTILTPLELEEAQLVLPFVMRMILRHRSYNQIVMRMDIRNVIDEFARVLNVKDTPQHQARVDLVNGFLSQDFTPEILQKAWYGSRANKLGFPEGEDCQAIWTTQAHVVLTQYRMRRRQSYGALSVKTESLLAAISLFIDDIAAKPARFESWVGLSNAYLYLTEDCLTFGDDTAVPNKPEKYCRQALLAASQAVALLVGQKQGTDKIEIAQKEIEHALSSTIWSLFGHLLFLAVMPPLVGAPFSSVERPLRPLLVQLTEPTTHRLGTTKPHIIGDKSALNLAVKCLSQPADAQQDWINAMYQTQAALKLDLPAEYAIGFAKRACDLCTTSARDPEVEYLNVVWIYHRNKTLPDDKARAALMYLAAKRKNVTVDENTDILQFIKDRLLKLASSDKWLHRPRYLLSQIQLLEYNDSVAAQEELMHLFTLKSPTKPLVIWNTEHNLPGEHRVAMTHYVRLLGDLMFTNQDSKGLLLLVRRFRRAGLEMWNHSQTCDYIHGKACELVRQKIDLDQNKAKYGESLISAISNDENIEFSLAVKAMSDPATSGFQDTNPWVQVLFYVLELRKNHTGLTALAVADELVISIFLTIFKKYAEAHPEKVRFSSHSTNQTVASGSADGSSAAPDHRTGIPSDASAVASATKKEKPRHKKIMRRDVVVASQQFLRQFQASFAKVDNASIPEAITKIESA